jgi:hypothetical protein
MTILLATPCNRPHQLRDMMMSLRYHAIDSDWYVAIGVDPWDAETSRVAAELGCLVVPLDAEVYQVPGYEDSDAFNVTAATNQLVRGRRWDQCWTINDDMRVLNRGWDKAISSLPEGFLGLVRSIPSSPCPCDFPVFSRAHYKSHGHIWPECFCGWGADSWMVDSYDLVDMTWNTGVCVSHGQCDHERMEKLMKAMMEHGPELPHASEYLQAIASTAGIPWGGSEDDE